MAVKCVKWIYFACLQFKIVVSDGEWDFACLWWSVNQHYYIFPFLQFDIYNLGYWLKNMAAVEINVKCRRFFIVNLDSGYHLPGFTRNSNEPLLPNKLQLFSLVSGLNNNKVARWPRASVNDAWTSWQSCHLADWASATPPQSLSFAHIWEALPI